VAEGTKDQKRTAIPIADGGLGSSTVKDPAIGNRSSTSEERTGGAEKRRWLPKDIKTAEWVMIAFTAVTAMSSWASVFVTQGQLMEMKSSSKQATDLVQATQNLATVAGRQETDTQKLAIAAQEQALASKDQAIAMDKLKTAGELQAQASQNLAEAGRLQAISTESLAVNTGKQLAASELQARAALTQADAVRSQADAALVASRATDRLAAAGTAQSAAVLQSLDVAREANQISSRASAVADRPWAGTTLPGNVVPQVGAEYMVDVPLSNSGRSPALGLTANIELNIYKVADSALPGLEPCLQNCQTYTLFPQASLAYHPRIDANRMTAEQIKRLENFEDAIILRTRFNYLDAYLKPHSSWSCSFYKPKVGFTSCPGGNGAN
jgi:hypothetical protein